MATGGIFTIIANDGKQDRMLTATDLLKQRLVLIRQARMGDPILKNDPTPTLLDIEKTHVLFMNAHFKPFAALGYEYSKVNAQSSANSLNSTVTFSIPQFGDFFSDMCVRAQLSAPTFLKASPDTEKASGRWCAYPGARLLQKVEFQVNGNPLDEYTQESVAMFNQFHVAPGKRDAWDRCMGQEKPMQGYLPQKDSSYDFTGTLPSHRIQVNVSNGNQTDKPSGSVSALDLFIPLLFWFRDPRLAVPSVAIPFGQRYIKLTLATQNQMFFLNANGNSSGDPSYVTDISVTNMQLYINNIFVNSEVHDIYIRRIGFTLIRVHREQKFIVTKNSGDFLLNNMKWPIETLYIGMRRKAYNDATSNSTNIARWHVFYINGSTSTFSMHGVAGWDGSAAAAPANVTAYVPLRPVSELSLTAHGIPLYKESPPGFLDSYIPFSHGGLNINSPPDVGAMMVDFSVYAGTYQPAGHINVSRAREFYVAFVSAQESSTDLVSSSNNGELVVCASAINFLLISDGSAVLRYST
jgi:hypothetical protein